MKYIILLIFICFGCKTNTVVIDDLGMLVVCWRNDERGQKITGTEYYRSVVGIKVEIYKREICFTYWGDRSCVDIILKEESEGELRVFYDVEGKRYCFVHKKLDGKYFVMDEVGKSYELVKTK